MSLKPWKEIARPHKDVLEATFKQSEFAADITQVATDTAPEEYQDAEKFFSRTYTPKACGCLSPSRSVWLAPVATR